METVVDDGLQHLLVVVCTLADPGQVGQNIWQQILVALRKAPKLTLSTLDLLLDMDPDRRYTGDSKGSQAFSCQVDTKREHTNPHL